MKETVPTNRRIYLTIGTKNGAARIELSLTPPEFDQADTMAVLLSRGQIPAGSHAAMSIPLGSNVEALNDIEISQRATVALQAGVRTVTIAAEGVKTGDALLALPKTDLPAGYAVLNAVASATNSVKVTVLAPLLAIGASYSIACRLVRLKL